MDKFFLIKVTHSFSKQWFIFFIPISYIEFREEKLNFSWCGYWRVWKWKKNSCNYNENLNDFILKLIITILLLPEPWVLFLVSVSPKDPRIEVGASYCDRKVLVGPIRFLHNWIASVWARTYACMGPLKILLLLRPND